MVASIPTTSRLIEAAGPGELFISSAVVYELVWVLEDAYEQRRTEISRVVKMLLMAGQIRFENSELLWQALADFRAGKADLADHVIGRTGSNAGCNHTLTFDRALRADPRFKLL